MEVARVDESRAGAWVVTMTFEDVCGDEFLLDHSFQAAWTRDVGWCRAVVGVLSLVVLWVEEDEREFWDVVRDEAWSFLPVRCLGCQDKVEGDVATGGEPGE